MPLTAQVRGGRIVLDNPVPLPEGATLRLRVLGAEDGRETASTEEPMPAEARNIGTPPTLLDALADVVRCVDDLPPDAAGNIDAALYGDRS